VAAALFALTFLLVAPFWLLMIVLPTWPVTVRIVRSPLIVLPAVLVYAALVLPELGSFWAALGAPTLAGVRELLGSDTGVAAACAHLLAFDLFAGRWIYLDGGERGLNPWLLAPVLVLTLLFGPLGLAAYLALRQVAGRVAA
jgi:hypothetical protein